MLTKLLPATLEDMREFLPRPEIVDRWRQVWTHPEAAAFRREMEPWVLSAEGFPLAVLGTCTVEGRPWVWAAVRPRFPGYRRFVRPGIETTRCWLDEHARGRYTTPDVFDPEYLRVLEIAGFQREGGLWRWRF